MAEKKGVQAFDTNSRLPIAKIVSVVRTIFQFLACFNSWVFSVLLILFHRSLIFEIPRSVCLEGNSKSFQALDRGSRLGKKIQM